MKFTVETNVLNEALKKAGATLSQKDNTPLFRNFALKAKDDKLTIMSTDTDLATICVVPVTNVEEGEVTIPGAKFQNIAKLTDSPNITVESEGTSIKVYSETTNYVLQGLDASEFPELAVITNQDTKKADRAQFLENLNRISFSISDNEARKNLLAVFIAKGYIQASDGHVSSVCKFDSQLDNLLIPSSAVTELVKVLRNSAADSVEIASDGNFLLFKLNDDLFSCRLSQAKFPDIVGKLLIPTAKNDIKIEVDKNLFERAVKRVSITSNISSFAINLEVTGNKMKLSSDNADGDKSSETLPVVASGDYTCSLHYEYLLDICKSTVGDKIIMKAHNNIRVPIRFENDDFVSLLMRLVPPTPKAEESETEKK